MDDWAKALIFCLGFGGMLILAGILIVVFTPKPIIMEGEVVEVDRGCYILSNGITYKTFANTCFYKAGDKVLFFIDNDRRVRVVGN